MMKKILLASLLFSSVALVAQEVQLNETPAITQLMRNWTNANRSNPRIDGWRIQVTASTDRQQAEQAQASFKAQYPDIPAEWIQEKPYYKVRVGAFRTRLMALSFLTALGGFPGAYPAKDANIHPRDFLKM